MFGLGAAIVSLLLLQVPYLDTWSNYAIMEIGTIYTNPALVKAQSNSLLWTDFIYGLNRSILITGGAYNLQLIFINFWYQMVMASRM